MKKLIPIITITFFFATLAFSQNAYVKPMCPNNTINEANHKLLEEANKINYQFASIIKQDPNFEITLNRIATINCELKSGSSSSLALLAEQRTLKEEVAEELRKFNNQ